MKIGETIFGKNRQVIKMLQQLPTRDRAAMVKEIESWGGYASIETASLEEPAQILMEAGLQKTIQPFRSDRLVVESRDSSHIFTHICFRVAQGEFLLVKKKKNILMRSLLITGEKVHEISRRLGFEFPGGEECELFWDSYMSWSAVAVEMLQDKHDLDWEHSPLKMHDWIPADGKAPFPISHPQVEEVRKRILALCRLLQEYEAEP